MNKLPKFVFVMAALAALFSSCKKTTDTSILEGHKWTLTSYNETYSDSPGVSHNLIDTACHASTYTQFYSNATNSVLKLAYTYITNNCPGQYMLPDLGVSAWNIDPDNTVLLLNASAIDGTGGTWFNIQSISSSSLVLTIISTQNTFPPNLPVGTHKVTDTWTYGTE